MIAILFAQNYETIDYYFDSGFSVSVIGCLIIFMTYKIDTLIYKMINKPSKSMFAMSVFVSFLTSVLLFFAISWILNGIVRKEWSLDFTFLKQQIIFINFLLLLILSYHTIAYFTRTIAIKNKKLKADNLEMSLALNKYVSRIPSLLNKKTELIPISQILFFKIEEGIIFAHTINDQKKPLTIATLNQLESKLNPVTFFRINRSEIVNIEKIESFEPYFKDRLALKIVGNKATLYTSNTKSPSFREWLLDGSN
jgi:hypothetical protein